MSEFVLKVGGSVYMFPAFKFQEHKYAKAMLDDGNVHLSKISIFRDSSKFSGGIFDDKEGIVTIHNCIPVTICDDYSQDNYKQDNLHAFPHKLEIMVNDAYIFCCTKYFLSDSLGWAISEGKESCVLITDVAEYINRVSLHFSTSLEFKSAKECSYIGREFKAKAATPYGIENHFIKDKLNAAFVKPEEYAQQRELRLLWAPRFDINPPEYINGNVDTMDLLIPVRFCNFDKDFSSKENCVVGTRIYTKSGCWDAEYILKIPNDVFTPIIHIYNGERMLGFLSSSKIFSGCRFTGGYMMMITSNIGNIVCNVPLSDVESIEVFTESTE